MQDPKELTSPVKKAATGFLPKLTFILLILILISMSGLIYWQYQQNQFYTTQIEKNTEHQVQQKNLANNQEAELQHLKETEVQLRKNQATSDSQLQNQHQQLTHLTAQFSELTGIRRQDWEIARLEYLLKLASQRLQLDADIEGAIATLTTADDYLELINDPALLSVRQQVSSDLHTLQSIDKLDTAGLYITLDTLISQIPGLQPATPSFEIAEQPPVKNIDFMDWLELKLNGLVKFTAADVKPAVSWLSSGARDQVNAMLVLRLMHAQQGLLTENQAIYDLALKQARTLVELVYAGRQQANVFNKKLAELQTHAVNLSSLDISGSHLALKEHLKQVNINMRKALLKHMTTGAKQ